MPLLLAAHPTVGHTSALRAIGAELRARGHATSFALVRVRLPFLRRWPEPLRAAASLPATIEAEGSNVLPLSPSLSAVRHAVRLPGATGQAELEIAIRLFTSALEAHARQVAAHARRIDADAVVADYLMPAAMLGARLARRRFVALYHSALPFPASGVAPFGTQLPESSRGTAAWRAAEQRLERIGAAFDARVARGAERLGLPPPPAGLLHRPISPDLNLLATAPELEPGLAPLTGPVLMTAPCLPRAAPVDEGGESVLASLPRGGRLLYISLGTVFNDKPGVFRSLIEGAAATGAHVVVSAGAALDALAPLRSATVQLFRRVPQVELLSRVDAVVTHGGNNTVQECLAAGRPMVVVPFGGDQVANAQRVERLGVGVRLPVDQLTPEAVRDALDRLAAPSVLGRAAALSRALTAYGGATAAADAVLRLCARG